MFVPPFMVATLDDAESVIPQFVRVPTNAVTQIRVVCTVTAVFLADAFGSFSRPTAE